MGVPFMKNTAVEFAEKTTKGTNIEGKFSDTATALATLQQAIEGKVVFDGEVEITYTPQDGYILDLDSVDNNWCVIKSTLNLPGVMIFRKIAHPNYLYILGESGLDRYSINWSTGALTLSNPATPIGFTGTTSVQQIGGDKGIAAANIPTSGGVYKGDSVLVVTTQVNATTLKHMAFYNGHIYAIKRATSADTNFVFNETTRVGDKPIYCHPVNLGVQIDSDNEFCVAMLIFNNDPTAFTFTSFCQWITGLVGEITNVRLLTSGYAKINGTIYPSCILFATAGYRQIVVSPGVLQSLLINMTDTDFDALTPSYFNDNVNRIN